MKNKKYIEVLTTAAQILKSVAHPVRIDIINCLIEEKSLSVNEIQTKVNITQSMASQHLKILKNTGTVSCKKKANVCNYYIKNKRVIKLLDCVEHCAKDHLI